MHVAHTTHPHTTHGHIKHIVQSMVLVPHTSLLRPIPFPLPSQHPPAPESTRAFSHLWMNSKSLGWPRQAHTPFLFLTCTSLNSATLHALPHQNSCTRAILSAVEVLFCLLIIIVFLPTIHICHSRSSSIQIQLSEFLSTLPEPLAAVFTPPPACLSVCFLTISMLQHVRWTSYSLSTENIYHGPGTGMQRVISVSPLHNTGPEKWQAVVKCLLNE